jgi:hypothetical protein
MGTQVNAANIPATTNGAALMVAVAKCGQAAPAVQAMVFHALKVKQSAR